MAAWAAATAAVVATAVASGNVLAQSAANAAVKARSHRVSSKYGADARDMGAAAAAATACITPGGACKAAPVLSCNCHENSATVDLYGKLGVGGVGITL